MQWKQNDSVRWPSRRPHVLPGDGRPPGRVAPASPDRVAVMQKTAVQGAVSVRSAARFVRCAESSSVSGARGAVLGLVAAAKNSFGRGALQVIVRARSPVGLKHVSAARAGGTAPAPSSEDVRRRPVSQRAT